MALFIGFSISCLAETFVLEAGDFEIPSGWEYLPYSSEYNIGSRISKQSAQTQFMPPSAGTYCVWVRSFEFTPDIEQYSRALDVKINSQLTERKSYGGFHCGKWVWYKVGEVELSNEASSITLTPNGNYTHTSAVLFTTDENLDPNVSINTPEERKAYSLDYISVLLEAEDFSDIGSSWRTVEKADGTSPASISGEGYIIQDNLNSNDFASTQVNVSKGGSYYLWSSAYEESTGGNLSFDVYVNSQKAGISGYSANSAGRWQWKLMGIVQLQEGDNQIKIQSSSNGCRVDALFLTQDPNSNPNDALYSAAARENSMPVYESVFIEAEDFSTKGSWFVEGGMGKVMLKYLSGDIKTASTAFSVDSDGVYFVWTCSYEYAPNLNDADRSYKVAVDSQQMPIDGYINEGGDAWIWKKLGSAELSAGKHNIYMTPNRDYTRVDAVFLTQDPNFNPNGILSGSSNDDSARQAYEKSYNTIVKNASEFNSGSWSLIEYKGRNPLYKQDKDTDTSNLPNATLTCPKSGEYSVWVCSYEFSGEARNSTVRSYEVYINGVKTKLDGYGWLGLGEWAWNKIDTLNLEAGNIEVKLRSTTSFTRFLAIALSDDPNFNPNTSDPRWVSAPSGDKFIVEAENFQSYGAWVVESATGIPTKNLVCSIAGEDATTKISFVIPGVYYVWACSKDFASDRPRTRTYSVAVDGNNLSQNAGLHGLEGYHWECLGSMPISAGEHTISLSRVSSYARCDALLFTTDSQFNPETQISTSDPSSFTERSRITRSIIPVSYEYVSAFPAVFTSFAVDGASEVSVENAALKISYVERKCVDGTSVWGRKTLIKNGSSQIASELTDEILFRNYSEDISRSETPYFSSWSDSEGVTYMDGKPVSSSGYLDPFCAGKTTLLYATSVSKVSDKVLQIGYSDGTQATITLDNSLPMAKMSVSSTANEDGYYTLGFCGFNRYDRQGGFNAVQMPSMFQLRRLSDGAKQVPQHFMSQPMVLFESDAGGGVSVVNGIVADPAKLPFEWSNNTNSIYGFANVCPDGDKAQSCVFSPILAGRNSLKAAGETIEASWYLVSLAGDWRDGIEFADTNIFAVSDLREPWEVSLSDAAYNIAIYLKGEASGWDAKNKGHYNIEGLNVSSHSSPLGQISVAMLLDDEDYYVERALPTFEFTLSRPGAHFSYSREGYTGGDNFAASYPLSIGGAYWGGDYFASANILLGGKNDWLSEFYYNANGTVRNSGGNTPYWAHELAMYLAYPSDSLLASVKSNCDSWMASAYTSTTDEPDMSLFVNVSLYPQWWWLPDLYEISGDSRYLEAAEKGAFYTAACLWSYPTPPSGNVVIHKDSLLNGVGHIWWKGFDTFRLGYEENRQLLAAHLGTSNLSTYTNVYYVPEKTVPAEKVSRIGLGIEQHSTYPGGGNICNPSWAPELLKVYQYAGHDILMKLSRHSIIGRYGCYMGYYVRDFSDIQQFENYSYQGPDVGSFYYHHAPVVFAQTFDYLMAQIERRSANGIKFPYLRQSGYVWFTNRIFGGRRGKVFFDEDCRLILDKYAVRPSSPKVSTMLARAKDAMWIIILNDSGTALENVSFSLDFSRNSMEGVSADSALSVYDASGTFLSSKPAGAAFSINILHPLGLCAVRIPAEFENQTLVPDFSDGQFQRSKVESVGNSLGDLHTFRIRGSFGKDSIYAFFTGNGLSGQKTTLMANTRAGAKSVVCESYPYEMTIYGLDYDENADFCVIVETPGEENAVFGSDGAIDVAWLAENYPNPQDYLRGYYGDTDADGYTGEQEYLLGTDPNDSSSVLRTTVSTLQSGAGNKITLEAKAGRTYKILWSDDMQTWSPFVNNAQIIVSEDSVIEFIDDFSSQTTLSAPASGVRFYKLEVSKNQ